VDFKSAYDQGFARVAACTIPIALADPSANAATVLAQVRECHEEGVGLAVFPELCLSGYSLDDLFLQDTLLDATVEAVDEIVRASEDLGPVIVVGAPLRKGNRLYNCAVVIHRGSVLGVVPKMHLPNYREFYEDRWFASGEDQVDETIEIGRQGEVPFGKDLLFRATDIVGLTLGVEICEDIWVPAPPSSRLALMGATVIANLSASPVTVGRAEDRRLMVRSQSARCRAAYVYTAAGPGESSTDLAWDGQTMVYECGDLLGESQRFPDGPRRTVVDVDLDRIRQDRQRQNTFDDNAHMIGVHDLEYDTIDFALKPPKGDIGLMRQIARFPFVPADHTRRDLDCYEAYNIQVAGLEQRLRSTGQPKIVLGVSGGLDSTHALIVAARAMDRLERPRTDIVAITMPGFATSDATKDNATRLAKALGVTFEELDIRPAAQQMLADLGHPFANDVATYDVTFENVQAGLRTDYLFRIANHRGGIVLGTGDLSELALGWCTYGVGDQMSHYGVNAGVPKTLIQHLIRWVVGTDQFGAEVGGILTEIVEQEISPELIPVAEGEKPQSTQAIIGPYELQDFTLYYVLRYGFRPSRIAFLALHAWGEDYDLATIKSWLSVFCQRFFGFSQFKRSALPNGPKVVAGGSLSPRGDWRMPSDASARIWLADLDSVPSA
jgi:NAD+ synthase (glutamine-hydrolysing)